MGRNRPTQFNVRRPALSRRPVLSNESVESRATHRLFDGNEPETEAEVDDRPCSHIPHLHTETPLPVNNGSLNPDNGACGLLTRSLVPTQFDERNERGEEHAPACPAYPGNCVAQRLHRGTIAGGDSR